jgi:NAD(P)-dependent dehydrogenase (short-subunit alcohol dehydrogenase family)
MHWAAAGVRFNCVTPGSTDTTMLASVLSDVAVRPARHNGST